MIISVKVYDRDTCDNNNDETDEYRSEVEGGQQDLEEQLQYRHHHGDRQDNDQDGGRRYDDAGQRPSLEAVFGAGVRKRVVDVGDPAEEPAVEDGCDPVRD